MDAAAALFPAPAGASSLGPSSIVAVSACLAQAKSPGEDGLLVPPDAAPHAPRLFAVVDGHGGAEVTARVLTQLPGFVARELVAAAHCPADALARGVAATEAALLADEALREQGACAVALLFTPADAAAARAASASVASVGDCVAVAAVAFEAALLPRRLSGAPHNLSSPLELFKAIDAGVAVELDEEDPEDAALFCKSPFLAPEEGGLQCTRSLGDSGFKRPALGARGKRKSGGGGSGGRAPLCATPHEACAALDDVAFIVLATDGVSDHLADGELVAAVAAHVAGGGARRDAAGALVAAATQRAAFAARPHRMSTAQLAALPCGEARRDVCDDMAAVVIFFR
jgi:pyruvate dehydrogenase phosphatase